ncbi:MAG: translation elongation factor Ts [Candidatus Saccharibacteria bacterium]
MGVSIEDIKKLKELSGIGLTDAKTALVEAGGDFDKALEVLRKKGVTKAEKKGDREAREGLIDSYVHGGRIGVIVEVNCETDFVARTDGFKSFAHEIALQIASMSPIYVSEADIPAAELDRVRSEAKERIVTEGKKPADMIDKIVDGQVKKHFAEKVLMQQEYIKNDKQTVEDFVKENIAKTGENLIIRQFKRIELGVND